ncbi:MAG TPA: DUF6454 family protein [Hyphomonadaceae bacterium]|nr:DUF6454 family protein [Hyphomonadaceae bacterium]HPN04961.1 DUF6454 family protein [Hyphomonadaceae bacterium]
MFKPGLYLAALVLSACTVAPAPAPETSDLAQRFTKVDRTTQWRLAEEIRIPFDTHHPQGMVRIDADFFITSVNIIRATKRYPTPQNGMDRDTGEGRGHLFRMSEDGALKSDIPLGEGDIYHLGGLDFDGRWLWIPVAEYRPNSRSIIYRVDPVTLKATEAFRVPDHIGAVAMDRQTNTLVGASWGSRQIYRWPIQPDGSVKQYDLSAPPTKNTSHFIDWQDCHGLPNRQMLCTGLAAYARPNSTPLVIGGAELIDVAGLRPLWQTPIELWSPTGHSMLQNPAWFEPTPSGLRAWFMPDDDASTLFAYDVDLAPR